MVLLLITKSNDGHHSSNSGTAQGDRLAQQEARNGLENKMKREIKQRPKLRSRWSTGLESLPTGLEVAKQGGRKNGGGERGEMLQLLMVMPKWSSTPFRG